MSESLRDLVVSLSLNTDHFTRNIKSVNKQIQEAESYFKLASAGVKDFDTSAEGLTAKLSMLERKLSLQRDAVTQYERALSAATARLRECYDRQEDYAQRLADAKDKQEDLRFEVETATVQYEHYRDTLGETDSATIAAKQNMEAAQQEYAEASAEVEHLAGQNDALRRSTQNAADAVSTAQTQLNKAEACATTMFTTYEINGYGFCTPCFSMMLKDHLYRKSGKCDSYGDEGRLGLLQSAHTSALNYAKKMYLATDPDE